MVLCCFILTACPAAWLFWAKDQGDGLPCWFKETQISHCRRQPEHQDMVAVWVVPNTTQQPGRVGVHAGTVGLARTVFGCLGKRSHTGSFLSASQHPVSHLRSQTVTEPFQLLPHLHLVSSSAAPMFGGKQEVILLLLSLCFSSTLFFLCFWQVGHPPQVWSKEETPNGPSQIF